MGNTGYRMVTSIRRRPLVEAEEHRQHACKVINEISADITNSDLRTAFLRDARKKAGQSQ
jgi:hypothetical protein